MSELSHRIRQEIEASGPISFARFMERALYYPKLGYYERTGPQTGRLGDYYTSVSVGSLFGELLAFQFAEWLEQMAPDSAVPAPEKSAREDCRLQKPNPATTRARLQIVEAGAHDGRLALDMLDWCRRHRPALLANLEYLILEPSPAQRRVQEAALHAWSGRVRWCESWDSVPSRSVCGVIFANELLDAFPVHRIAWDARQQVWFEWGVDAVGERFEWVRLPNSSSGNDGGSQTFSWPELPGELLAVLPDQFTTEICPAAERWWHQAATALRSGRLLTLDYGLKTEEFFVPQRAGGTLRNYRQHRQELPLLANPGEQDLTADVNFSALQLAGEAAGLGTEGLFSQAEFLTRIAEKTWRATGSFGTGSEPSNPDDVAQASSLLVTGASRPESHAARCRPTSRQDVYGSGSQEAPESFGPWTPARVRQFQTLTHPEHLGRSFRVLVQARS